MDKLKVVTLVFVLFAVFFAAGAVYVYCNNDGSYNGEAYMNDDGTISYRIEGPSTNYGCSVFSETETHDGVYLYIDDSYKEFYNTKYVQNEYFNVLKSMLERRGATVHYANSTELVDVMGNGKNAVVFVTGALPDTVYDGTSSCIFNEWMDEGGTVYWSGPEIGRYVLHKDGVDDLGVGFFHGNVDSDDMKKFAYNPSPMFECTQMRYDNCAFGLSKDHPNSRPLAYISDEGYCSVSVAKYLNGNITVVGGNMAVLDNVSQDVTDRTTVADLIVNGLTYRSEGLEHRNGSLVNSVSSRTTKDVSSYHDVSIWLTCGDPASHWSKCIRIN